MTWRRAAWVVPLTVLISLIILVLAGDWEYAWMPSDEDLLNPERGNREQAWDIWGQRITQEEADSLVETSWGEALLSPGNGAVRTDDEVLQLGRETFYRESFSNEHFLTDVMGVMDGPISFWGVTRALISLRGRGTTNLQVKASRDAVVGNREISRGDVINTGLDVARGALVPLGIKVRIQRGRPMMGITCAACHAAYDPVSEKVVEGAPNIDLNAGLLLAMSTNSASFLANTDIDDLEQYITDNSPSVTGSDGKLYRLPDPDRLEQAVDELLMLWPPGTFDSSNEMRSTPTSNPDSFTRGDHPYGWTGFAMAGPFRGLSMLNNNVHGMNSDKFADIETFHQLHGIDREQYLGILLQRAARESYRYDPDLDETPSEFFARNNPTEVSSITNDAIALPSWPLASFLTPNGYWIGTPGFRVWEEVNAMSAFQNSLVPPSPPGKSSSTEILRGRRTFLEAGCRDCHSGPAFTNNQVIPAEQIGTEPVRARAFEDMDQLLVPSTIWAFSEEIPVRTGARMIDVPLERVDRDQLERAWAIDGSGGGYKVKGLLGLYWSPPYLHDGGVAVGQDPDTQLGVPGTLFDWTPPDPTESLRALLDRELRERVVEANRSMSGLDRVNVLGTGHEYWVDEQAGFTVEEQESLIEYLLNLEWDEDN